jgi:hypothetical protein
MVVCCLQRQLSKTMNQIFSIGTTSPMVLVEEALKSIVSTKELGTLKFGWASRLRKIGVTFVVTIEQDGVKDLVPLRVKNKSQGFIFSRKLNEQTRFWHGKYIHDICIDYCKSVEDIIRRVRICLKTALNRLMQKINRNLHKRNIHLARRHKGAGSYHRAHAPRMCH